jgi:hypothetical protein
MVVAFQRHYNHFNIHKARKRERTAPDGPKLEQLLGLVRWLQRIVARPNWTWPWPAARDRVEALLEALLVRPELAAVADLLSLQLYVHRKRGSLYTHKESRSTKTTVFIESYSCRSSYVREGGTLRKPARARLAGAMHGENLRKFT